MMPLYMCRSCGSVENTALGSYWQQEMVAHEAEQPFAPKCSACFTGEWHGKFPRKSAAGMMTDKGERYIYSEQETAGYFKHMGPFHPVAVPVPVNASSADAGTSLRNS